MTRAWDKIVSDNDLGQMWVFCRKKLLRFEIIVLAWIVEIIKCWMVGLIYVEHWDFIVRLVQYVSGAS